MIKKIKVHFFGKRVGMILFLMMLMPYGIMAQTPIMEIPSSPNPVGSGARALGMGGAFISIADDATAASWNPGGLIQLDKPEISAVFGYIYRNEDNSFSDHPESENSQGIENYHLNYLSAAYPFQIRNYNMIVSLNYQHLYNFYREWDFNRIDNINSVPPAPALTSISHRNYEQEGEVYALGLAYCIQIVPSFSLGITLNYWGDFLYDNSWEQKYHETWDNQFNGTTVNTMVMNKIEEFSFSGWNANLGFLWRLGEHWTIGGVFKTPFDADIDYTMNANGETTNRGQPPQNVTFQNDCDLELSMPMSYGIGIAYRFSDNFTIAGDIYRTHWNDFELDTPEGTKSPISGLLAEDSDVDATTWLRFGGEYIYIGKKIAIPVRAGIFYDPAPAEGSPDDYYGLALGSGIAYDRFVFDIAYQYRWGSDVGSSTLEGLGFSQDVSEHTLYMSLIVHF